MSKDYMYIIGFYSQAKTGKISIPKDFEKEYSFTLQPSSTGETLPKGEYLFQVNPSSIGLNRNKIVGKAIPLVCITDKRDRNYIASSFRSEIFDILITNYYPKAFRSKGVSQNLHRSMRIFRSLGYDWVSNKHNEETRRQFCSELLERIVYGDFNPYEAFWKHAFKNPHKKDETEEESKKRYFTLFDLDLEFNPKYDRLIPANVCSIENGYWLFESSDVGSYINVEIRTKKDISIYRKYITKAVDFKVIPADTRFGTEKVVGYYKFPEDLDEFTKMIEHAQFEEILIQRDDDTLEIERFVKVYIPDENSKLKPQIISPRTFPELYFKIYDRKGPHIHPNSWFDRILSYRIAKVFDDGEWLMGSDKVEIEFKNKTRAIVTMKFLTTVVNGPCLNYEIKQDGDKYFFYDNSDKF